jgi:hypothetical protein
MGLYALEELDQRGHHGGLGDEHAGHPLYGLGLGLGDSGVEMCSGFGKPDVEVVPGDQFFPGPFVTELRDGFEGRDDRCGPVRPCPPRERALWP